MSVVACPHVPPCSGCPRIATPYEAQLDRKLRNMRTLFQQANLDGFDADSITTITPSPNQHGYRNRARLAIRSATPSQSTTPISLGLYRSATHDVVDIPHCPVQTPQINTAVEVLRLAIHESGVSLYDEHTRQGDLRYITVRHGVHTGELLLGVVATRPEFPGRDKLARLATDRCGNAVAFVLNVNPHAGNVIFGRDCHTLVGREYIEEQVCDVPIRLGLLSFFQINTAVAERAYQAIIGRLVSHPETTTPDGTLIDLYSGVGTIGLAAARRAARVIGVEEVDEAVRFARSAAATCGFDHVEFKAGLVEDQLAPVVEAARGAVRPSEPLFVSVNPPRKGLARGIADRIAAAAPDRIAYLSCAPATLIRDLRHFTRHRYTVSHVELFDMFPQTDQVETLAMLERY